VTTTGRPTPGSPADDSDTRPNVTGLILIGAAVLIGLVLLLKGFSQEGGLVSTAGPEAGRETTTTAPGPVAVPQEVTTTTAAAAVDPATVSVLVANATGGAGVAGTNASKLQAAGYTKTDTSNADVTATSVVYFTPGNDAAAQAVAAVLGIPGTSVQALPSPPPTETRGASVVVLIGTDLQ
jgi:hypothetical protein